jgi:hypothetical protein
MGPWASALRCRRSTQQRSVPLALASLVPGPLAAKPVFMKSILADLPECAAQWDARDAGDSGQPFRCCSHGGAMCGAGRSAGPNGPLVAGADSSARVGPSKS